MTPVVPVRCRADVVGETARVVHLISVPAGDTAAVSALCGMPLIVSDIEPVSLGHGMPCNACLLNQVASRPAEPLASGADSAGPLDGGTYQAWGWPVAQRGDRVRLNLDRDVSAFVIPAELALDLTQTLTARRCTPAVPVNPYMPGHHVLLAGERYGIALSWPSGVHQITGHLLLPPTATCRGKITWIRPPMKDSLRLCREIDLLAALRTAGEFLACPRTATSMTSDHSGPESK
ncbi:MAG TPA: hypothetical protein VFO16_18660 [Pseudonocardiaceae bacterium]|nr:hypothetical protein [Pseudonocardiaceae bacterium]